MKNKINKIEVNGNNNIIIHDIVGSHIYINSDEGAKQLYIDFKQEIGEIRALLKQRKEPILQQFAEKIYNIAKIDNAYFQGGIIKIESAKTLIIDRKMLTEEQLDRLEILEGLERRFKKRLTEKMKTELRFQLELNLEYTTNGTNDIYLKDYFIDSYENKFADSFVELFNDFENSIKRLLILGEPGAGKTVLLLQFGLALVDLAKQNFDYPVPIILDLATWGNEIESFESWLEENLVFYVGEYGVSKKYAKELVKENNLLLILDGLDEISAKEREDCLAKMKEYIDKLDNSRATNRNYPSLIIGSRKQEYLGTNTRAPVRAMINIAYLTSEKVLKELTRIKDSGNSFAQKLLNINTTLQLTDKLKTAFEVHLSLNMAYKYNFINYTSINLVSAYLYQEIAKLEQDEPNAKHYLSFLSIKLKENNKGIAFELIDLQPNWLNATWVHSIIMYLIISTPILLFFSIFDMLLMGIFVLILLFVAAFVLNRERITHTGVTIKPPERRILKIANIKYINILSILKYSFGITFLIYLVDSTLSFFYVLLVIFLLILGINLFEKLLVAKKTPIIKNDYGRFLKEVKTSLFLLVSFASFCSLFAGLMSSSTFSNSQPLQSILYDWLLMVIILPTMISIVGLIGTLWTSNIIPHIFLRLILWIEGNAPIRYCKFLNKVSKTGLMEKHGCIWRFRHQLLQEVFIQNKNA